MTFPDDRKYKVSRLAGPPCKGRKIYKKLDRKNAEKLLHDVYGSGMPIRVLVDNDGQVQIHIECYDKVI